MTRDEIVALFERRNAAWNRHDAATVAAGHAEDAIGESPIQGRLVGRKRIEEGYAAWMSAFRDLSVVTEDLIVDGNRVVQFFNMTGTQTGAFGGLPPTGRRFQISGAVLITLGTDGLITHHRALYDVTKLLVQLGALRAKPATETIPPPEKLTPIQ